MTTDNAWLQEATKNASAIEDAIQEFEKKYNPSFFQGEVNYRSLKDDAGELRSRFKGVKLQSEVREKLWKKADKIISDAFDGRTKMFEKRKLWSAQKREGIEPIINSAMNYASGGKTHDDFDKSRTLLGEALAMMKNGWSGYNVMSQMMRISDGRLTKDDREALWSKYTAAQERLHRRREEISETNHQSLMRDARSAVDYARTADRFKDASNRLKEVGAQVKSVYLHKEHRSAIHEKISEGFEVINQRFEQMKSDRRKNAIDFIHKLEGYISKGDDTASRLQGQIDQLQSGIRESTNSGWVSDAEGWIREKQAIIDDIESRNTDMRRKIREVESEQL